jgi:hypothetical protein
VKFLASSWNFKAMSLSPSTLTTNQTQYIQHICDLYDKQNKFESLSEEKTNQNLNVRKPSKYIFDYCITHITEDELIEMLKFANRAQQQSKIELSSFPKWKMTYLKIHRKANEILNNPLLKIIYLGLGIYITYKVTMVGYTFIEENYSNINIFAFNQLIKDYIEKRNAFIESTNKLAYSTGKGAALVGVAYICYKIPRTIVILTGCFLAFKATSIATEFLEETFLLNWIPFLIKRIVNFVTPEKIISGLTGFIGSTAFYYENLGNIVFIGIGTTLFIKFRLWKVMIIISKFSIAIGKMPLSFVIRSIDYASEKFFKWELSAFTKVYEDVNQRIKRDDLAQKAIAARNVWIQLVTRSV